MSRPWRGASIALALLAVGALGGIGARAPGAARPDAPALDGAGAAVARGAPGQVTETLPVDLRRSVVRWRGTKFRGRGKHEGTVRLAAGTLALCGARVCGGRFVLDMRSIAVTDIPPDQPVPRARLTNHLNSPDFFWTGRYPTATFVLRQAAREAGGAYQVAGELTLRGVTRPITFPAALGEGAGGERRVGARLQIDRQRWGVAYRFDPIRNEIVDDDIHLDLEMVFPNVPQPLPNRSMPEDVVVARARAGDAGAFALVYQAHVGRVHALCLRLSGDVGEARELTQDVFVRVWEKLPLFRGESALGTWIHRMAVNTVLERQRATRRRVARVEVRADLEALHPAARPAPVDERLDLDAALARLSPAARLVFVLREMEGYSFAEISALTGTSEVTLRSQLHRARTQLVTALRL